MTAQGWLRRLVRHPFHRSLLGLPASPARHGSLRGLRGTGTLALDGCRIAGGPLGRGLGGPLGLATLPPRHGTRRGGLLARGVCHRWLPFAIFERKK